MRQGDSYPIKEEACCDTRPGKCRVCLGFLVEIVYRLDFALEDLSDHSALSESCVDPKLGRDEALHSGLDSGVDQWVLAPNRNSGDGGNHCILALKGRLKRVY